MRSVSTAAIPPSSAPFLLWPVSRREFYRGIWVALLLPITWGVILFGVRPLSMFLLASAAATLSHVLLKRVFRWRRGRQLLYQHSMVGALLIVALAHPTWPIWIIMALSFLLPFFFAWFGGPGKERIHLAVAAVVLVQYALLPVIVDRTYTRQPDAILARDRLVVGDIRDQIPTSAPHPAFFPAGAWPYSRDLAGNDAFPYTPPALVAAETFNQISNVLVTAPLDAGLSPQTQSDLHQVIDRAFAFRLPSMDLFFLGVAPNRIGAASLIGITIAGLFLSYRYILRPRSVVLFLSVFFIVSILLAFTPNTVRLVGPAVLWQVIINFPEELISLLQYLLLNSDAPFAAVFILALPGTEPLTPRGRRYFLILAALLGATLHRLDPLTPHASLALCLFMPLAPLFDRLLATPSWLNARR